MLFKILLLSFMLLFSCCSFSYEAGRINGRTLIFVGYNEDCMNLKEYNSFHINPKEIVDLIRNEDFLWDFQYSHRGFHFCSLEAKSEFFYLLEKSFGHRFSDEIKGLAIDLYQEPYLSKKISQKWGRTFWKWHDFGKCVERFFEKKIGKNFLCQGQDILKENPNRIISANLSKDEFFYFTMFFSVSHPSIYRLFDFKVDYNFIDELILYKKTGSFLIIDNRYSLMERFVSKDKLVYLYNKIYQMAANESLFVLNASGVVSVLSKYDNSLISGLIDTMNSWYSSFNETKSIEDYCLHLDSTRAFGAHGMWIMREMYKNDNGLSLTYDNNVLAAIERCKFTGFDINDFIVYIYKEHNKTPYKLMRYKLVYNEKGEKVIEISNVKGLKIE